MLQKDFLQQFNRAVHEGNWPQVRVLGEAAVADYQRSPEMLFNLGIAYLKAHDAPTAVSVLLAVPEEARDEPYRLALQEALRQSGHDQTELDMGAHGFTGILSKAASSVSPEVNYALCAGSLAVGGVCLLIVVKTRWQKTRTTLSQLVKLATNGLAAASCLVTLFSLSMISLNYFYGGHWAAVIAPESAPIRLSASQDGEVLKALKPGQPVLVLGDPTKAWVKVIESGGGSGWMNALDIRCVHGRF